MSAPAPVLSVIIACRNAGADLPAAAASVWAQAGGPDTELVVVDGASTDETAAWLAANRARLGAVLSEPDHGVYDAMNKGVALARGDWLLFLGADDRLEPGALAALAPALAGPAGVVAGRARYTDGRLYHPQPGAAIRRNFLHHQACVYRRATFPVRGFDTSLRLQADYDVNLQLLHGGAVVASVATLVATCRPGGASDAGLWANYREEIAVRHRYFPAWRCWPWDALAVGRWLRKRLVRG